MKRIPKVVLTVGLIVGVIYIFIPPSPIYMFIGGMQAMPRWRTGSYGEDVSYYTSIPADSLVHRLRTLGYSLQEDTLRGYEANRTTTHYQIKNLICGSDTLLPHFEIAPARENGMTQVHLQWIGAKPSQDEHEYKMLNQKYQDCFQRLIIQETKE